jgi:hypothetical protein
VSYVLFLYSHCAKNTLQDWKLFTPFVPDCDLEKMGRLLRKTILRLPKHLAIEPSPPACDLVVPRVRPASCVNIR